MRLLIDASSILWACLFNGEDKEFGKIIDGKRINSAQHGYENFTDNLYEVITQFKIQPKDIVLVKDGFDSRAHRRLIYKEYKAKRDSRSPELFQEFNALLDRTSKFIKSLNGITCEQEFTEADDVIAYLAKNLYGKKLIWTRDADMLVLRSTTTHVLLKDELNPLLHGECPAQYQLVYKSLIGDTSDNIPGAKGFGKAAFHEMGRVFGEEAYAEVERLIREKKLEELESNVADFKPIQKILDNKEMVYTSYECAQFYDNLVNTGRKPLKIETGICEVFDYQKDHPVKFKSYYQNIYLATELESIEELVNPIKRSPYVVLDVETYTPPESDLWCEAIANSGKGKKKKPVDVFGSKLAGCSLTFGPNLQYTVYFPIAHNGENVSVQDLVKVIDVIEKPIIIHNTSFELPVLYNEIGFILKNRNFYGFLPNVRDTMIMKSYVNENTDLGLKFCSKEYLGYIQTTYEEVTQGRKMSELTPEEVLSYGADDTICTAALFNRFKFTMELENTWNTFEEVETYPQYVCAKAFVEGIPFDTKYLNELEQKDKAIYDEQLEFVTKELIKLDWPGSRFTPVSLTPSGIKEAYLLVTGKELKTRNRKIEKLIIDCCDAPAEFTEILGELDVDKFNNYLSDKFVPNPDFNPASPKKVTKLLYEVLDLPVRIYNKMTDAQRARGDKQGTPSTDKLAVEYALKFDSADRPEIIPLLKALVRVKQYLTRKQLYYEAYPLLVHWKDGKVHPQAGQSMTTTRRFAPHEPNTAQIAKHNEDGKHVRAVILPYSEDELIVSFDEAGQEMRVIADQSGDPNLVSCFVGDNKRDAHSLTGLGIAKNSGFEAMEYEIFTEILTDDKSELYKQIKQFRTLGKKVNFTSEYGALAPKLAKTMLITEGEAQLYLDARHAMFARAEEWKEEVKAFANDNGYTLSMLGARRHLHDKLYGDNKFERLSAERQGVNYIIQGSCAEMLKLIMKALWTSGLLHNGNIKCYMPVHDELVFSIKKSVIIESVQAIHKIMIQQFADMEVPLASSIGIGPNFCDLDEIGENPSAEILQKFVA